MWLFIAIFMISVSVKLKMQNDFFLNLDLKQSKLISIVATVGVELLATTHADKDMANVLPNNLLVMRWQRFEILVTDITEVNPVSPSLSLFPSSDYINSSTNPPLTPSGTGASR